MEEVRVQHPVGTRGLEFVEKVYRCELEELDSSSFILKDLQPSESKLEEGMPILHKGFFESHAHPSLMCETRSQVDLSAAKSLSEVISLLLDSSEPSGGVVQGHSWTEAQFGMSLESFVQKLGSQIPNHVPIVLTRICGHSAFVNKALKELFGLTLMPDLLKEEDFFSIKERLPTMSLEDRCKAFKEIQREFLQKKVTSISELWVRREEVEMYQKLCREGSLLLDVAGCVAYEGGEELISQGPFEFFNKLSVGPLDRRATFNARHAKFFLDGTLGSRTAALLEGYADAEGFGQLKYSTEEVISKFKKALEYGFFISAHAIGDAAASQLGQCSGLLNASLKSRLTGDGSTKLPQTYHRFEHAQLLGNGILSKFDPSLWTVAIQPGHCRDDAVFIRSRIGDERFANAYWQSSLIKAGFPLALGSDAPISSWHPKYCIDSAVEHPNAEQRISFSQAIWSYTTGSRLALGLNPGKLGPRSTVFLSTSKNP